MNWIEAKERMPTGDEGFVIVKIDGNYDPQHGGMMIVAAKWFNVPGHTPKGMTHWAVIPEII